jgi:hypothetical protein
MDISVLKWYIISHHGGKWVISYRKMTRAIASFRVLQTHPQNHLHHKYLIHNVVKGEYKYKVNEETLRFNAVIILASFI